MTPRCPSRRLTLANRLPSLEGDANRLYGLLTALSWPSRQCEVDLYTIGSLLGLRPISVRLALLALRMSGRIAVRRRRGRRERWVVTLFSRSART